MNIIINKELPHDIEYFGGAHLQYHSTDVHFVFGNSTFSLCMYYIDKCFCTLTQAVATPTRSPYIIIFTTYFSTKFAKWKNDKVPQLQYL